MTRDADADADVNAAGDDDAQAAAAAAQRLGRCLDREILPGLAGTRGADARIDVYLRLNELLRLDDTPAIVGHLRRHLPGLLGELAHDLAHAPGPEVLHLALRTLSYLMYHRGLAPGFSEAEVAGFGHALVTRLAAATTDEPTYRLCLWCLTMHSFDPGRHAFLEQALEALVQAIINPFKSRAIEIQALKGLQLLARKFRAHVVGRSSTLRRWFRPVVSRLGSSDATTREHVLHLLQEATAPVPHSDGDRRDDRMPPEAAEDVTHAWREYALPAMQRFVDRSDHATALGLWRLTLVLLCRALATDLALLNEILYVPEAAMRHVDPRVRLLSMEAWGHLTGVFAQSREWLFKKTVLQLLVRPVLVCLADETAVNVVAAALQTWRTIVGAVVRDFNAFCQAHGDAIDGMPQLAKKWKRWMDETVNKVVLAALEAIERCPDDDGRRQLLGCFITGLERLFEHPQQHEAPPKTKRAPEIETESSSATTSSSVERPKAREPEQQPPTTAVVIDLTELDDQRLDEELRLSASTSTHDESEHRTSPNDVLVPLGSYLLGLAFILPDVLSLLQKLARRAKLEQADEANMERHEPLARAVWMGFMGRLGAMAQHPQKAQDTAFVKLRLRLLRLCLDFAFGVATASTSAGLDSQASVVQSLPMESVSVDSTTPIALAPSLFSFSWQLWLVAGVVANVGTPQDLGALFVHPKTKISNALLNRIDAMVEHDATCRQVAGQWDLHSPLEPKPTTARMDFSAKANVVPCALLYLLLAFALMLDDPTTRALDVAIERFATCITALTQVESIAGTPQDATTTKGFIAFVLQSLSAAKMAVDVVVDPTDSNPKTVATGQRFLEICLKTSSRSEESQENAAVLLQLHSSPVRPTAGAEPSAGQTPGSAISVSSDPCSASPCLLEQHRGVINSDTTGTMPTTPTTPVRKKKSLPRTPTHGTTPSAKSPAGPPPPPTPQVLESPARASNVTTDASTDLGPIYPDLVTSAEPISLLHRHFPLSFRPFFQFFGISTVGDLSRKTRQQIRAFGIRDPVGTVIKALDEFTRRKRERGRAHSPSPFRLHLQPSPSKSRSATPSPHHPNKRSTPTHVAPLPLAESPQRKRVRRSLEELSSSDVVLVGGGDEEEKAADPTANGQGHSTPKLADKVTFRLELEGGETRITRPGEESQEVGHRASDTDKGDADHEGAQERVETYSVKLLQHLRRSVYYIDKLAVEEESLASEASLGTSAAKVNGMLGELKEAHVLVARLSERLQAIAESNAKRCERVLSRNQGA